MPHYLIKWKITKMKVVEAMSEEVAMEEVENIDIVHDGIYVDNSYEFIEGKKIESDTVEAVRSMVDRGEG